MQGELDIRPYINLVIKNMKKIVAISVAVAVIFAIIAYSMPLKYTSSSNVLILPSQSQVSLDSRFITTNANLATDISSRRQSILGLAESTLLEQKVHDAVSDVQQKASFSVQMSNQGDLIVFTSEATDPDTAVEASKLWAENYSDMVNDIYGWPNTLLDELQLQYQTAKRDYDTAQKEFETFILNSDTISITQEISSTNYLLYSIINYDAATFTDKLAQIRNIDSILFSSSILLETIDEQQPQSLATEIANLSLQVQILNDKNLPIQLLLGEENLASSPSVLKDNINSFINELKNARTSLVDEITEEVGKPKYQGNTPPELIDLYVNKLVELNTSLERETSEYRWLQSRRNVLLDNLLLLEKKIEEQKIVANTSALQVRYIGTTLDGQSSPIVKMLVYGLGSGIITFILATLSILMLAVYRNWMKALSTDNP
jgi:hypothetical protein